MKQFIVRNGSNSSNIQINYDVNTENESGTLASLYDKRVEEVKYWTSHSGFCCPPALFKSFVHQCCQDFRRDYQWTTSAMLALQTLVEYHLISLLEKANTNIIRVGRKMLHPLDILNVRRKEPYVKIDRATIDR